MLLYLFVVLFLADVVYNLLYSRDRSNVGAVRMATRETRRMAAGYWEQYAQMARSVTHMHGASCCQEWEHSPAKYVRVRRHNMQEDDTETSIAIFF